MYQRTKIVQAFKEAGLEKSKNKKMPVFVRYISENPKICWPDAAKEFREKYFDLYDDVVKVILRTEDALIISNLLKYIDLTKEKEAGPVKKFLRDADAFQNEAVFMDMIENYYANVADSIHSKAMLPRSVLSELSFKKRELELIAIKKWQKDEKVEKIKTAVPRLKKHN